MTFPEALSQSLVGTDLLGGDPGALSLKVTKVNLRDGSDITLPAVGVTLVVGPNNAGKSTLLRETLEHLSTDSGGEPSWQMVPSLSVEASGSTADLVAWLAAHNKYDARAGNPGFTPLGAGQHLATNWMRTTLSFVWTQGIQEGRLGRLLASFLVHYANTDTRLGQSKAAPVRADARDPAIHPVHVLADDRTLLKRTSEISQSVFNEDMWLDDYSAETRLRVGAMTAVAPKRDEVDITYREELLGLPELAEQGDGMRSFFGLLLPLITAQHPVVLVDEPEAFLHPPQAAALGRVLGRLVTDNSLQLMVASHDRHLLVGLLESRVDLTVVRVDRFGNPGGAKQIDPAELRSLWAEPALKYSNALDGLFHRLVVLVEGDRDARFYAASLDAANEAGASGLLASDVLFVPCGGKGGMTKIAKALRDLGVPTVATPDIDILANEQELKSLVEGLGGTWNTFKGDFDQATARIVKDAAPLKVQDVTAVLKGEDGDAPLTLTLSKTVQRLLRTAGSGWTQVKAGGIGALGTGGTRAAAVRLFEALDQIGLVIVRVGELEGFAPDLDVAKGAKWLPAALDANVHKNSEAQAHVLRFQDMARGA